jgi:hypothetical protein
MRIDPNQLSPELRNALQIFGEAFVRFQAAGFATERAPSGTVMKLIITSPPSIGENYHEARRTLLTFRKELPLLEKIDYDLRRKQIEKSLGDNATDDEYSEEYLAAEKHIWQIEDYLAAIGFKLGLEK